MEVKLLDEVSRGRWIIADTYCSILAKVNRGCPRMWRIHHL
jgi:hypothetical protein